MGGMGFLKLISQAFPRPLPQSPLVFFPALSLALFFARAPLSERLEQATKNSTHLTSRDFFLRFFQVSHHLRKGGYTCDFLCVLAT